MFDSLEEAFGKYESQQIDAIRGIETVKALAAEEGLRTAMLDALLGTRRPHLPRGVPDHELRGERSSSSRFVSLALFLVVGGLLVIDGQLTIGEFVAFNALVALAQRARARAAGAVGRVPVRRGCCSTG